MSLLRPSLALALLLGVGLSAAPAFAQSNDRGTKSERRVLKSTDQDAASQQSEEYRAAARAARQESMERLKQLISNYSGGGDTKAEMILRLADLYFSEGRDLYLDEMKKFSTDFDKCFNEAKTGVDCSLTIKQEDYTVESRKWQDKSIKLYKQILQNYPQFNRADEATFYLGQALNDTNKKDDAKNEFTRLVKNYPESKWVPDAYLQIGEYFFDNNQATQALSAYQRAAAYKEFDKYAFANYKLAWCWFNVGEYGKAIETMKSVVSYSMAQSQGDASAQKKNLQLQDEALKDLVRFFADAGEMDEAYAYFNKLGKKELIRDMLKRLASTYFEQGKFDGAIQTYRRLIAEDPQGPAAPDFQNEIISCYTKMGQKETTLQEIEKLRTSYGKNSAWARANASNQDAVKTAGELIEKNLRTVATNYHNEAKKLRTGDQAKTTYALAEKAYEVYVTEYPDSKYSYDMRYAYGELLYTIKKFEPAYDQYMKVVSIDKNGQHSKFCAESAIFAADELVKKDGKSSAGNSADPGKKTEAQELTPNEKKLLAALDQWQQLYKDDPKTRNIIYKSAYLLYNKNQFKEASDRFRVVIGMDPKSKEAEQAANLILDSFNLTQDWTNLKDVSKSFYDQQGLGSDAFKKEVYGIYENASLKLIDESFKKTQDKAKGAADYWAFYKEFPSSANADLALNNASVYYNALGRTADSMKVRQELISKFPKSKYYVDQVAALAYDYESIADFDQGAQWYEKFYALVPATETDAKKQESAKAAIYSAALFRTATGQWEQGIKDYQQYITRFPSEPNISAIKLETAKIYEKNGKAAEASKVYLEFFSNPKSTATVDEQMFSRLRYGLLMEQTGQAAKQAQHWKDTIAYWEKNKANGTEISNEAAGQIKFSLVEADFKAYMAMKIDGPGGKTMPQKQLDALLKKQLVDKATTMPKLEARYNDVIATGAGRWGLAALVRLGEAYENLADSLTNSYTPAYLTEDQAELYKMALEDKAYPQTEKAVNAYSEALKKAYEFNLYNEETAEATRRLGVLRPNDFPGLFETIPAPSYAAPSEFSASYEKQP